MGVLVEATQSCKAVWLSLNMWLSNVSVQVWQDGVRPVPEALRAAAHREGGLPFYNGCDARVAFHVISVYFSSLWAVSVKRV